MNEPFRIVSHNKHYEDVNSLAKQLHGIIDTSTIFVAMSPENVQPMSNFLRHRLSFLNRNEVIEECQLNIPTPVQSQVWDEGEQVYVPFDSHLQMFMNRSILNCHNYVFLASHIHPGNERWMYKTILACKARTEKITVAGLYLHEDSTYTPDYYVEKYKGTLIYEWQNSNNAIYSTKNRRYAHE